MNLIYFRCLPLFKLGGETLLQWQIDRGDNVMKIYYEVKASEIPKNCLECPCNWCRLPCTKYTFEPRLLGKYREQRHEACPLKTEEDIKG